MKNYIVLSAAIQYYKTKDPNPWLKQWNENWTPPEELMPIHKEEDKTPKVVKTTDKIEDAADVGKPLNPEEVTHKVGDMTPGSQLHKETRWKEYQERGGEWSYERWSKQYDTNMRNVAHGLSREREYRSMLGGVSKMKKTKFTYRQIDIYKADKMYMGQLKTGKVYLTKQAKIDIQKDAWLAKEGYKVEYILEDGVSQPFIDALKANNIDFKIGSQISN